MRKHRLLSGSLFGCLLWFAILSLSAGAQTSAPNEWRWIGGSNNINQPGVGSSLGVALPRNIPGGRQRSVGWTDKSGNFWLFGGTGVDFLGKDAWLNDLWKYSPSDVTPQNDEWIWMSGSGTGSQPGVYGALGTSAAGNVPGGRQGSTSWIDDSGKLWLFGGYGLDASGQLGLLNDLWKFDPSTNQWAWMSGNSMEEYLASNLGYGQPGVYGTLGVPASGNAPGGREFAVSWTDKNGNFWLFGGQGDDANGYEGQLNDLWKFDPSSGLWTWMDGNNSLGACVDGPGDCGQPGVYGALGTPAAGNIPGGRSQATSWIDSSGDFWLFGGTGYDSSGADPLPLNDLWKFNPATNEWTWMSGSNLVACRQYSSYNLCDAQPSVYGTLGVPAAGNVPGGRSDVSSWIDSHGNFWLFGGSSLDVTGQVSGLVNDLWVFNPSTSEWAWMGGNFATSNCSYIVTLIGTYPVCDGSQGVLGRQDIPGIGNIPGSRTNAVSWIGASGNFWLFSGGVTALSNLTGSVNDLWEFQPSTTTLPPAATPIFSLKPGLYLQGGPLTISNGMTNASIYYTTDGTIPTSHSTPYSGAIIVSSTEKVQAIATAPGYVDSGVESASYIFVPVPATPVFSIAPGTYASVETVTISDTSPYTKIYYTTDGTTPTSTSPVYSGPITVSSSETINAIAVITGYTLLNNIAFAEGDAVVSAIASSTYSINLPQAAIPTFSVTAGSYTVAQTVSISDATTGAAVYYTTDGTTPTTSSNRYTSAINVSSNETLEAIAAATGYADSAVASAAYTIVLPALDFSVAASPTSLTVTAGQSGTETVSVTPQNGFSSAVTLSCSGLPSGILCSFSPASVTPSGAMASTTLTVITSATVAALEPPGNPLFPVSVLAAFVCCLGFRKRRRLQVVALLVVSMAGLGLCNGCGGGASSTGSPTHQPTMSTITVTAAAGSLEHTTTFSLTVN